MNNWRLLLLAVVAVFQPIASFTDRNLIDGRQQCCDRLSSAPLRDTRSSLHGTYRLDKEPSALRRLNDRDDVNENRRYELRQRDFISSRLSTERPLVDIRERIARQEPSVIAKASRGEYRLERTANFHRRERLLDGLQKEEIAPLTRNLQLQDDTRRVVDRTSRNALERHYDRTYTESPRENSFRHDYRTKRFGTERLFDHLSDFQRETQREQIITGERRFSLNRDARRILSRTKSEVASIEASDNMDNRQRIARERLNVLRREPSLRADTRRYIDHGDKRQDQIRNTEERRSLSENTRLVDRVRDMRIRVNAREDNQQRIGANQRFAERLNERSEDRDDRTQFRQNKENIHRRASGERMQVARKITRASRIITGINNQNERSVDNRREIRQQRMLREIKEEMREYSDHRPSRERIQMDRRNTRESRMMNSQNIRDVDGRQEVRQNERMSKEIRGEIREDLGERERIQLDRRNLLESRITNVQNKRNVNSQRETRQNKMRDETRANVNQRLSRERIQVHNRNIREAWNTNEMNVNDRREIRNNERILQNTRDERTQIDRSNIQDFRLIDSLISRDNRRIDTDREARHNERWSREARGENRLNPDHRLSLEIIQFDRRNIREFRTNNRNDVLENRHEIRHNDDRSAESRKNPELRIKSERIQMDRRNIRESRNINNIVIRSERDVESRREVRNNVRFYSENRENRDRRVSRERFQVDRSLDRTRESRIVKTVRERDLSGRQEIRYERLSRDNREEMRENPEHRLAPDNWQNIRESRINRASTRNGRGMESDSENRREIRHNERISGQTRDDRVVRDRRVELRSTDRANADARDNTMDRRARSVDRRNFREIRAEPRLSRSTDTEHRSETLRSKVDQRHKIENSERETTASRFRNVELARNRESMSSVIVGKMETENDFTVSSWQYVLYTLQAAYLCALFMQMLTPNSKAEKHHKMTLRWLPITSRHNAIKVD